MELQPKLKALQEKYPGKIWNQDKCWLRNIKPYPEAGINPFFASILPYCTDANFVCFV